MAEPIRISKKTLDAQAADVIREQILDGTLAAGEKLTETSVSEEFGLSRGTIRAAFRKLVAEGLILQVPYTGWEVMPLSARDAWELYTLRSALEGLAARLAAEKVDQRGRADLSRAMKTLEKACQRRDRRTAAKADFDLHKTIIRLSGHDRLAEQYDVIARQVQRYIVTSDALLPDEFALVEQHQPMVDAILAGEAREAEQLARDHNKNEGSALVAHLSEKEEADQ